MPDLLLMRHAKSDWSESCDSDHDRPLAARGVKAAGRMGLFLASAGWAPAKVLTSSAVRARATAELAAESGQWACPIEVEGLLYEATPTTVLDLVAGAWTEIDGPLLVVGHQPTLAEVVQLLVGGAQVRLPTAAVACLRCRYMGGRLSSGGCAELRWLITPKLLG